MLTKEQKVEIIKNAVKEHFNIKKVNLLNIIKYLNSEGNLGGDYWRILVDGDDLIGQTHSGQYGSETEFIVAINSNKIGLTKQSENVVNEIYNMLPKQLKQNQD